MDQELVQHPNRSCCLFQVKVKAFELRKKDEADIVKDIEGLKKELMELRVNQVTGAAASKLARIRIVRKSIARALTVQHEKRRTAAKEQYKGKYVPKDLRKKLTRAMRRRLTPQQANKKTVKYVDHYQHKIGTILNLHNIISFSYINCLFVPYFRCSFCVDRAQKKASNLAVRRFSLLA